MKQQLLIGPLGAVCWRPKFCAGGAVEGWWKSARARSISFVMSRRSMCPSRATRLDVNSRPHARRERFRFMYDRHNPASLAVARVIPSPSSRCRGSCFRRPYSCSVSAVLLVAFARSGARPFVWTSGRVWSSPPSRLVRVETWRGKCCCLPLHDQPGSAGRLPRRRMTMRARLLTGRWA